jgi:AcrR family transcriptional regulator
MTRIVKDPDERRAEIINTSAKLFREKGYEKTSVESIIREMDVAKGTFYYYFKSKGEVMKAIVDHQLDQIVQSAEQVANDENLDALTKMKLLLGGGQIGDSETDELTEHLHHRDNRELHEQINVQSVLRLSPVFEKILIQGKEEGLFQVERPLETFQFLLTGAQFLTDEGLFYFSPQELGIRMQVIQEIAEKALGAPTGSFDFFNKKTLEEGRNERREI